LPAEQVKPKPLLNGHDLLRLGYVPGPGLGKILRQLEEKQLSETITTRKDALAFAKTHRSKSKISSLKKNGA
jgi:poly(A) polymerase